jgi:hypothetical protein
MQFTPAGLLAIQFNVIFNYWIIERLEEHAGENKRMNALPLF